MQLSNETTAVLKNFASINPNLLVKPGTSLRTISPTKSVMARATVEEEFDKGFAIFDLSQFLGRLSLFDKRMQLQINYLIFKGAKQRISWPNLYRGI